MIKVSVIIPSYKDPLLHRTIDSLLTQSGLGEELEVIPVCDGYIPETPIIKDDRVRPVYLGSNVGMRRAINAGVRVSRGEFLIRADEHQVFGDRYDLILYSQTEPNWIVTPRRYFLDVVKWEVMDTPPVDFMRLKIVNVKDGVRKFSGVEAPGDDSKDIQESMAMQGSCWGMWRKWWDMVIGELQNEGYGPLIQDSTEMVFKTWQAGGKLMVNKNTWHAHKHRDFPRMHNNGTLENPAECDAGYQYAIDVWGKYYEEEIRPRWGV